MQLRPCGVFSFSCSRVETVIPSLNSCSSSKVEATQQASLTPVCCLLF